MTAHQLYSKALERQVELLVAMDTAQHLESARKLCQTRQYVFESIFFCCYCCLKVTNIPCSYWMGVVHLSVAMGDKRTALHTMLRLRDKRLFSTEQKWGECYSIHMTELYLKLGGPHRMNLD